MSTTLEPRHETEVTRPAAPAPTLDLSGRAVLVSCKIKCWSGKKRSKEVSKKAMVGQKADPNLAGRTPIYLVDELRVKALAKSAAEIRTAHYSLTLPYDDAGRRMLKSGILLDYTAQQRKLISAYESKYNQFLIDYPDLKENAKGEGPGKLGDEWREKDYPTPANLRERFGAEFSVEPLPTTHWMVEDAGAEFSKLAEEYNQIQERRIEEAQRDAWERLLLPVAKLAETLSDPTKKFKDTLVGNVSKIVDSIDALNITDDPEMTRLADQIRKDLLCAGPATLYGAGETNPQELRDNHSKRAHVAEKASAIADQMAAFMG